MTSGAADDKRTAKLQFHYVKGPEYREAACHGVLGGLTPQKKVWMALFSERHAIPRVVEFHIPVPEGQESVAFDEITAKPAHVEQRQGIVRHVELTTYLDLDVAIRVHTWLGQRIDELQRGEERQDSKAGQTK
jgi:hypothetical protein